VSPQASPGDRGGDTWSREGVTPTSGLRGMSWLEGVSPQASPGVTGGVTPGPGRGGVTPTSWLRASYRVGR